MSNLTRWRHTYTAITQAYYEATNGTARSWREVFTQLLAQKFTREQLDRWLCHQTNPGEVRRRRRDALTRAAATAAESHPPPLDQAHILRLMAQPYALQQSIENSSHLDNEAAEGRL